MSPFFFKKLGPINIDVIKNKIVCETKNISDSESFIDFVGYNEIEENTLSFIYDSEKINKIPLSATLICTYKKANELNRNQKIIIVENVQKCVAVLSNLFYRDFNEDEKQELKEPLIGENCRISSSAVIENGVIIGDNVIVKHGAVINHNCIIGNGSFIGANAVISNSIIDQSVEIGRNSSIGQAGFGFYLEKFNNIDIFHIGRVLLKSKVSIGSCCTIDRGSFSDTIIGENTYLDNLCHVAHNVVIGSNSAFAAMTGIAGSTKVGNNVLTGGQAGIAGHIKIGDNVQIAAKSGVFKNLVNGESVMGNPAINRYKYLKEYKKIYGKR